MSYLNKTYAEYEALEKERTDISYREGIVEQIRKQAFDSGVMVGRYQERDYVLQFVVDHEFSNVPITGRDVADELTLRTKHESRRRIDKHLGK